jgi:3-isopropylmalate/(R)-2-methylmalate dehydratase small subunit
VEQQPGARIAIDLEAQTVTGPNDRVDRFDIDPFRKQCLLAGTDDIQFTLGHAEQIAAFEKSYERGISWL